MCRRRPLLYLCSRRRAGMSRVNSFRRSSVASRPTGSQAELAARHLASCARVINAQYCVTRGSTDNICSPSTVTYLPSKVHLLQLAGRAAGERALSTLSLARPANRAQPMMRRLPAQWECNKGFACSGAIPIEFVVSLSGASHNRARECASRGAISASNSRAQVPLHLSASRAPMENAHFHAPSKWSKATNAGLLRLIPRSKQ